MTATVVSLDGRPLIRVTSPEGYHLGDYPTPEAITAAGIDLAELEIK